MPRGVLLLPEAESEIHQAIDWYYERSARASIQLAAEVDRLLERINHTPAAFPMISADCRSGLLRRFPYRIVFCTRGDVLVLVAFAHLRRRPDYWLGRL